MFGSSHLMSTETLAETPNRKWMNYKIQCSIEQQEKTEKVLSH